MTTEAPVNESELHHDNHSFDNQLQQPTQCESPLHDNQMHSFDNPLRDNQKQQTTPCENQPHDNQMNSFDNHSCDNQMQQTTPCENQPHDNLMHLFDNPVSDNQLQKKTLSTTILAQTESVFDAGTEEDDCEVVPGFGARGCWSSGRCWRRSASLGRGSSWNRWLLGSG